MYIYYSSFYFKIIESQVISQLNCVPERQKSLFLKNKSKEVKKNGVVLKQYTYLIKDSLIIRDIRCEW